MRISDWSSDVCSSDLVRPGDELRVECEVLEVRPSKSRPDQGLVKLRTTTLNQDDRPVQISVGSLVVMRREAIPAGSNGWSDIMGMGLRSLKTCLAPIVFTDTVSGAYATGNQDTAVRSK